MSKSVEELFKDAPDGTTHWDKGISRTHGFMKLENGFWFYWPSWSTDPDWDELCDFGGVDMADMIPRPQPKPWSGPEDGLPPAGSVLHLKRASKFTEGTRLDEFPAGTKIRVGGYANFGGHDVLAVIVEGRNFTGTIIPELLMPIKTPEQLAAEKRETAIREFMDVVGIDCRVTASKAVDAGFKREVV